MNFWKILMLMLFSLVVFSLNSQSIKCGTNLLMEQRLAENPDFQKRLNYLNQQIEIQTQGHPERNFNLITIPVIVHVLWNTSEQNITDAQIFSQIDVLNGDFGRTNNDTSLTREIFKTIAADTRIRFCLAQRDPAGNPTNGINRVETAVPAFGADDAMKFSAFGGADAWPADQYLNIWVCNNWEVWGYAYFPGIEPEYDGVVCHFEAFGDTLQVVSPLDKGRTCTHEVGHWLGLYHPFDFECTGISTQSCLGAGDRVCDTPGDATESYNCDFNLNTCTDSPNDFPDMVENFMDYSDDVCLNLFTVGQAQRMQLAIETFRQPLLTSNGCVPNDDPYIDAVAVSLIQPSNGQCATETEVVVRIGNGGNTPLSQLQIDLFIDEILATSTNWEGTLVPNSSIDVELSLIDIEAGIHQIKWIIAASNGVSDDQPVNDTLTKYITILDETTGSALPFGENFESGLNPPESWYTSNPDLDYVWDLSAFYGGYASSSNSLVFENYWVGELAYGRKDYFISPIFDFTSVEEPTLSFDLAYPDPGSSYYSDTLGLYWSEDCGVTWDLLWRSGGEDLASAATPTGLNNFEPSQFSNWKTIDLDLSMLKGKPSIRFSWENKTGWGYDLYLDNININGNLILGDDAVGLLSEVMVYPNPNVGDFTVSGLPAGSEILLFATDGRIINRKETSMNRSMGFHGLLSGVYVLCIKNGAQQIFERVTICNLN